MDRINDIVDSAKVPQNKVNDLPSGFDYSPCGRYIVDDLKAKPVNGEYLIPCATIYRKNIQYDGRE